MHLSTWGSKLHEQMYKHILEHVKLNVHVWPSLRNSINTCIKKYKLIRNLLTNNVAFTYKKIKQKSYQFCSHILCSFPCSYPSQKQWKIIISLITSVILVDALPAVVSGHAWSDTVAVGAGRWRRLTCAVLPVFSSIDLRTLISV